MPGVTNQSVLEKPVATAGPIAAPLLIRDDPRAARRTEAVPPRI